MSILRKYNKTTGEWEVVSYEQSPDQGFVLSETEPENTPEGSVWLKIEEEIE